MGLVTNGTAISVAAFNALPFDPVKQFDMVSTIGLFDLVLVVNAQSEFKTVADFLKAAKAAPGKLNIGTIAVWRHPESRRRIVQVAGRHQRADRALQEFTPTLWWRCCATTCRCWWSSRRRFRARSNDGKLKVLATSSAVRSPFMPDVPTVAEAGVKGYEGDVLERRVRAEGHAEGHHRHHERGDPRRAGAART